jgi:DNA-binding PadR family transcriptional regulator
MSANSDKRRRGDLDLFVLALIECGIATPYELKTAAGLSPGATIPALARLLEAGFVLQSKPGRRGRVDHKITVEGRRYLKSGWKELIEDGPSGDLDADLRVALLALWLGDDRKLGADFLRQSAGKKLKTIRKVEESDDSASLPMLALWYKRLRAASAKALIKGESAAALAMARALPGRPSGKQKQNRAASKPKNRTQAVPKGLHEVFVDLVLP